MARKRITPLFPIGISVARAAECLEVHRAKIDAAIKAGELRLYQHGVARRILVADLVEWVRTTWKIKGGRHVPAS
jgi:excisionase family DNA binding protein